jgi:hypothetical protein
MPSSRLVFLVVLIAGSIFSRLLPHPPNFTAIGAAAIFAGAFFSQGIYRRISFLIPLVAMVVSDWILGFHALTGVVYLALGFNCWLGLRVGSTGSGVKFAGAGLATGTLFYLVTNFGVWAFQDMYPHTLDGLMLCYAAALPFLGNSIAGDVLFTLALVSALRLAEKYLPAVREPRTAQA